MKTAFLRTMALVALASLATLASAEQPGFANVTGRWWGQANGTGARQTAFEAEASDAECQDTLYNEQCDDGANCDGAGGYQQCQYGCPCDGMMGYDGCPCEGYPCDGGCPGGCDQCGGCNSCNTCSCDCEPHGMCYAEIQNMFLRAHVSSDVVGKLSEKYEYSPRMIVGYESACGIGVRGRYWNYDRETETIDDDDSLRFDMDVIDLEGTARFSSKKADLVVSGGFRWASMKIEQDDDDQSWAQMPGITFAIDGRMVLCGGCRHEWAGVCGARWSVLGGDWEGESNDLIVPTFDDNMTTQELYGGVELVCHKCKCDLFARLVFEMQNWHSDTMGESSATDSISFVGPAIHGGISY